MILLDTSFLIDYFRGIDGAQTIVDDDVPVITTITYHEILAGAKRSKGRSEERFFRNFFQKIDILGFDSHAAEESGTIAAKLAALGTPVNTMDVLIAGIALAQGVTDIVTGDEDFLEIEKISDIRVRIFP